MQTASYVALSSQAAIMRQMDIVANNIANASTTGYKAERVMFQQYVAPAANGSGTAFVYDARTYRDNRQGPLTQTGNPLDVAIDGHGYLAVSTPAGTRYTRNGHLQLDSNGTLVTADGYQVEGDGGGPITLPAGASNVVITRDGSVSTRLGPVGKIRLVDFADENQLNAAAGGLYVTTATPTAAADATLRQGMIEGSNVQPIVTLTRMMTISRNYEAATDMIKDENDRIKNALDKLSQTV